MPKKKKVSDLALSIAAQANNVGNYIERRDPVLATQALELLAEGESINTIRAKTGMKLSLIHI